MGRVVHLCPEIGSALHPGRIPWLRRSDVKPQRDVLVLRPVLQDLPGQVVAGPLELVLQLLRVLGIDDLVDLEIGQRDQPQHGVIRRIQLVLGLPNLQRVDVYLPFHLVVLVEVQKLRQAFCQPVVPDVSGKTFLDKRARLLPKLPKGLWFCQLLRRFQGCCFFLGISEFVCLRLGCCDGRGHLGRLCVEYLSEFLERRRLQRFIGYVLRQVRIGNGVHHRGLLIDVHVEAEIVVISAPDVDLRGG